MTEDNTDVTIELSELDANKTLTFLNIARKSLNEWSGLQLLPESRLLLLQNLDGLENNIMIKLSE